MVEVETFRACHFSVSRRVEQDFSEFSYTKAGYYLILKEYFYLPTKSVDNFVDKLSGGAFNVVKYKGFCYVACFLSCYKPV
jgi:hypothetical protein